MIIRYHRLVQHDLNEIIDKYYRVNAELSDDFFAEFKMGLSKIEKNPGHFHFDGTGLRRCNLDRFPYHILFDIDVRRDVIRVWVVRHDHRRPSFGRSRFSK